ncbi:hypothetical protein BpHYR1_036992 [Brachionus plicatilis]|uniref:Uncharacterized protein n=1 Tax=Brachionus plicatilis TaxID=10195 RepID=A0A3M7SY30_BRAPC|nr:hypothetical protein BpHYR1_036992 [Brachionus plicatilis]
MLCKLKQLVQPLYHQYTDSENSENSGANVFSLTLYFTFFKSMSAWALNMLNKKRTKVPKRKT